MQLSAIAEGPWRLGSPIRAQTTSVSLTSLASSTPSSPLRVKTRTWPARSDSVSATLPALRSHLCCNSGHAGIHRLAVRVEDLRDARVLLHPQPAALGKAFAHPARAAEVNGKLRLLAIADHRSGKNPRPRIIRAGLQHREVDHLLAGKPR